MPDGQEGLRAVGQHHPNVLVTDIEMPQRTGLELTARVRELYPATPHRHSDYLLPGPATCGAR